MFYLILYIILYIWLNWKCHCWPSLTDYQVSFTRSIYSEVNGPLEPCCHARSVCCQRTKSLTGGTWNEVERCGTARPATWCIRLGCLPGLRSQCGSGARKPSMRSMHSRRSTGPCQAPKSRKSPKSNTERTTTAKLRLSVFSWNKLNKDQTMNHEQSKRVITEDHHSGPPIDMAKKTSAFRSSRLNARFTWKRWKMKKNAFGKNT